MINLLGNKVRISFNIHIRYSNESSYAICYFLSVFPIFFIFYFSFTCAWSKTRRLFQRPPTWSRLQAQAASLLAEGLGRGRQIPHCGRSGKLPAKLCDKFGRRPAAGLEFCFWLHQMGYWQWRRLSRLWSQGKVAVGHCPEETMSVWVHLGRLWRKLPSNCGRVQNRTYSRHHVAKGWHRTLGKDHWCRVHQFAQFLGPSRRHFFVQWA